MRYLIPKDRIEDLKAKIARISKKAERYNSAFTFEILGEKVIRRADQVSTAVEIEISGNVVNSGWEYVGKIVREIHNDFNVVEKVQNIEIPEKFYTCKLECEHCHKDIYRKYTYLVRNTETGEFIQVGRTCLRDYTGIDLEYLGHLMSLEKSISKFWGGLRPEKTLDTEGFLRVVSEVCRKNGNKFIRESTEEFPFPTVQSALSSYYVLTDDAKASRYSKGTRYFALGLDLNSKETSEVISKIRKTVTDPNIRNTLEFRTFPVSFAKTLCEEVFKYYRDANAETEGEYFGKVGEKFEFNATDFKKELEYEKVINGYELYTSYLYSFKYNGCTFKWFSANEFENHDAVHIKGTIKAHQEYRKVRETIVRNCKLSVKK